MLPASAIKEANLHLKLLSEELATKDTQLAAQARLAEAEKSALLAKIAALESDRDRWRVVCDQQRVELEAAELQKQRVLAFAARVTDMAHRLSNEQDIEPPRPTELVSNTSANESSFSIIDDDEEF